MKTRKIFLSISLLVVSTSINAQDFHLSQYDIAPLYMNPALTGVFPVVDGSYRATSIYRSQWASVLSKPFTSAFISFDKLVGKADVKKWGVGGYVIDNNAMSGSFNTLNAMGSLAYNIMSASPKHYLTVGMQLGIGYKTLRPNNYTYDEQYDASTNTFNSNLSNGENFNKTSFLKFERNMGVYYKYIHPEKKIHPEIGFSIYHMTKPNESITGGEDYLPMRFNGMLACDFIISEKITLHPKFLVMFQGTATEYNEGILMYYKLATSGYDLVGGFDYRFRDASVFHIGFKKGMSMLRFSYDINTSTLANYSSGRGAWEVSLSILGLKGKSFSQSLFY